MCVVDEVLTKEECNSCLLFVELLSVYGMVLRLMYTVCFISHFIYLFDIIALSSHPSQLTVDRSFSVVDTVALSNGSGTGGTCTSNYLQQKGIVQ